MRITGRFFYRYEASAGGGSGRSYSSGEYATGESAIKMDTEVYDSIVAEIETQNDAIIESESGYVVPDAACLLNNIIPDYEEADHEVVDMLRLLKKEGGMVVDIMKKVRQDFVDLDTAGSEDADRLRQ